MPEETKAAAKPAAQPEVNPDNLYNAVKHLRGMEMEYQYPFYNEAKYDAKSEVRKAIGEFEEQIKEIEKTAAGVLGPNALDSIKSDIANLKTHAEKQHGRWLLGYKCEKEKQWDPGFNDIKDNLKKLNQKVDAAIAARPDEAKLTQLRTLQGELKKVEVKPMQEVALQKELKRITTVVNDRAHVVRVSRARNQAPKNDYWEKVHRAEEDRITKLAAEKHEKGSVNAAVSGQKKGPIEQDKDIHNQKGAGLYRKPSSDYYMSVGSDGKVSPLYSPQRTSFANKVLTFLASPVLIAAYGIGYFGMSEKTREDFGQFINQHDTFERRMGELMKFVAADPSNMIKSDIVVMSYDSYDRIGKKQVKEILATIKLAEAQGLKLELDDKLADKIASTVSISNDLKTELWKALKDHAVDFKLKQSKLEEKGESSLRAEEKNATPSGTPPTPPPPPSSTPIMTAAALDKLEEKVKNLATPSVDDKYQPDDRLKNVLDVKAELKDGLAKVKNANQAELRVLNEGVDAVKKSLGELHTEVPLDKQDEVKKELDACSSMTKEIDQRAGELQAQVELEAALKNLSDDPSAVPEPNFNKSFEDVMNEGLSKLEKLNQEYGEQGVDRDQATYRDVLKDKLEDAKGLISGNSALEARVDKAVSEAPQLDSPSFH